MKPLLVFPCNGNALEALDCLADRYALIGFVDDAPAKQGRDFHGHRVFSRHALQAFPDALVLAVPGNPETFAARRDLIGSLEVHPDRFVSVVHPSARVSPLAIVGRNVLLMAGVVITSNGIIGDHVCILPNSVVHHDVVIGDGSLIGSNVTLAGGVCIEKDCYIGSGTSVIQGARIGARSLVGLGANLIASFPPDVRVVGNPARIMKGRSTSAKSCG